MQLAQELSQMIYRGDYKAGNKLPSESELCRTFCVSRITVRQAITLLIQKDLVFSVHGKGTFVKTPSIGHELNRIVSFRRSLEQKGLTGYTRIRSYQTCADNQTAQRYFGSNISCLCLIGFASNVPVVYYESYFPPAFGERMLGAARQAESDNAAFSTFDLYKDLQERVDRIEQTVRAVNADEHLERILEVPRGKALLVLESVYLAEDGTPLEYKLGYYHSDIYSFHLQRQI